jgi:excisionase family DNA binding protein
MDELFSVSQAAQYLKICEKTLRRLIKSRKILASKVANKWRLKKTDIDIYLKSNANGKEY